MDFSDKPPDVRTGECLIEEQKVMKEKRETPVKISASSGIYSEQVYQEDIKEKTVGPTVANRLTKSKDPNRRQEQGMIRNVYTAVKMFFSYFKL